MSFLRKSSAPDPLAKVHSVSFATRHEFSSERGEFYIDLAQSMQAMRGVPITQFLENYATRHQKRAIGKMAQYWLTRFSDTGTFTESIRGTVPKEDLTLLAVSEKAGDLASGLQSLGENVMAMGKTKQEMIMTMAAGMILIVLLHAFLAIQAFMVMPQLEKAMTANAGAASLGLLPRILFGASTLIRTWWPLEAVIVVAVVAWIFWSLPRYTGRGRAWLDDHVLPYQMYRDFQGAAFFVALGSVTKLIGSQVIQVADALQRIRENSVGWLAWHIDRIMRNMEEAPTAKGELFNTGIVNERNYYRVVDIAEYAQLSTMLNDVGALIMKTAPVEMAKSASKSRFALMLGCVMLMFGVYGATLYMINDFKNQAQIKAMVR
ncbi:hypothetical protein [Cupriavidus sp. CuC1]|uniref:hypothetical protein n=1 Tax=Cupriavidus sp. CuC1 TaxID=3373131 RepID=UPI0037D39C8D